MKKYINLIPWFLSLIAAFGSALNIFKLPSGFVVWSIANCGWIAFILGTKNKSMYGQILIWVVFTIMNIWGFLAWIK